MHAAVRPTGEVPSHPRVGRAEEQIATIRTLANPVDVLQYPDDFGAGEVGAERKARCRSIAVGVAVSEAINDGLRSSVLPDNGVVDRLAGSAIPDDRCLALVGDADGGDIVTSDVCLG